MVAARQIHVPLRLRQGTVSQPLLEHRRRNPAQHGVPPVGKVVVFSVPGAFTPTCSKEHLPGFIDKADAIKAKGVDTIACMAVNDMFVMDAWGNSAGAGDKVLMLADGNGTYAAALGLELDASGFGLGTRGQRFALVVEDGTITQLHVEAPMEFKVSSADNILENL